MVLIVHNIRSTHNVGSIFRTAECLGVDRIYFSGYTPYPTLVDDTRLPHISRKLTDQIHKTALGAETIVPFSYDNDIQLETLQKAGYEVVALEQAENSIELSKYTPAKKVALVIGEEVNGVDATILAQCDKLIEIPMSGTKESLNVSVATGIALYELAKFSTLKQPHLRREV